MTLEEIGLGERPYGPPETSVRLLPWAAFPGQIQQAAAQGDHLYFAINYGQIYEYDLRGNASPEPFLDIPAQRPNFVLNPPHGGLRGLAFHPEFDQNGLLYTFHHEAVGSGRAPDYGDYGDLPADVTREHLIAEWDFNNPVGGAPGRWPRPVALHSMARARPIAMGPSLSGAIGSLHCRWGSDCWRGEARWR